MTETEKPMGRSATYGGQMCGGWGANICGYEQCD